MDSSTRAWLGAALVPVGFVVGLIVAFALEGAVVGDQTGGERSWAVDLLELAVVVVLVAAPASLAWRATGPGTRSARLTATVLAVALLGWLLVQLLLNAVAGRY